MTTDVTNYKTSELAQSVDVDDYAVRDEAERRQTVVARKLAKLYAEEARLEKEQIELGRAIQAAWAHLRQEQPAIVETMLARMSPVQLECRRFDGLASAVDKLIRHDESRIDEKLRQLIAAADAEADRNDGREPGDTRDEESLEDHNIQGLGAYRDVFDAGGEQ